MASVIMDLAKASGSKTLSGWKMTRVAHVSDLSGDAEDRIPNAIAAVEDFLGSAGSIGASYPGILGCLLNSISATGDNGIDVEVTLEYDTRQYDVEKYFRNNPVYTFSSGLAQVETVFDKAGNKKTLTFPRYVGPDGANADSKGYDVNYTDSITPSVNKDVAEKQLIVSQKVYKSVQEMNAIWDTYGNKINSADWFQSGDAGLWKMTGMNADPIEGETAYNLTCTFTYREVGWVETVYYRKPDGQAPSDEEIDFMQSGGLYSFVVTDEFELYNEVDFNNLFNP